VGHALDRLRQISEALSSFYSWDLAEATTYVLTGQTPVTRSIIANVRLTWPLPARSRITLTVAPTATPAEVAAVYSRERRMAFGRVRRLTDKYATLAAFAWKHTGQADLERMTAWNKGHAKKWRYTYPSVFRREANLAINALLELQPHRAARRPKADRLSR
jgi:hypothetical protein